MKYLIIITILTLQLVKGYSQSTLKSKLTKEQYNEVLKNRGNEKLAEKKHEEEIRKKLNEEEFKKWEKREEQEKIFHEKMVKSMVIFTLNNKQIDITATKQQSSNLIKLKINNKGSFPFSKNNIVRIKNGENIIKCFYEKKDKTKEEFLGSIVPIHSSIELNESFEIFIEVNNLTDTKKMEVVFSSVSPENYFMNYEKTIEVE